MKKIISAFTILFFLFSFNKSSAQQINWRNLNNNKAHLANINMGWDYGTVAGISYAQKLKTKLPIALNIGYSSAFGKKLFDDFKTKVGVQAEVFKMNQLSVSAKVSGIYRRYENKLATLADFGAELSTNIGYYKSKWYAAAEFGFDKAISTHIKNSREMKSIYPAVKDGWYVPTGGNFFYGIATGYSFKSNDIYIKAGRTMAQDLKTQAAVPWYLQVGFNRRF